MASQKDNLKALAEMGITIEGSKVDGILPLKGDESAKEVAGILKAAKAKLKETAGSSNQDSATGKLLVWVKGRTYINETQRIDAGLYRLDVVPERLAKSPTDVVEVFANDIPPRKLTEIAKWSGVSHPEDYEDDELLTKITIKELKPF